MPKSCVAVGCTNHNMMVGKELSFNIFPDKAKQNERWNKWVQAVKRINSDGSKWEPRGTYIYLCSDHLITGTSNRDPNHPDYIPSQFAHLSDAAGEKKLARYRSANKRRGIKTSELSAAKYAKEDTPLLAPFDLDISDLTGDELSEAACLPTKAGSPCCSTPAKSVLQSAMMPTEREAMYEELNNLHEEKDRLQEGMDNLSRRLDCARLDPSAIEGNDDKCRYFTGLSWDNFVKIFDFLKPFVKPSYVLTPMHQFFLTLVRLRLNISSTYLSQQTGVSKSTINDSFWNWIDLMYAKLSFLVAWPDRETMKQTLPPTFKAFFPRLTGIMDCFEIFIDRPKNLKARAQVYSNYKKHSTVKVFIVCSPLGAVTFMSAAWGGRVSDVELVRECGFMNPVYHQPGDQLLADRGFTLVDEFAVTCGAELIIPAFTKGRKQMSPKEVETSRGIAAIRIHIERVIGLIKNRFAILQGPIPIIMLKSLSDEAGGSELTSIDKLVKVCGALTNLGEGIVYKE